MDTTRQIIPIYVNMAKASFVNADNTTRGLTKPVLFVGNESLFTCQVFSANGAAQALPATAEFYASLDDTYGPGHADLVAVTDDLFNMAADWDNIDLAAGKICFRLTTATQALLDLMAAQQRKDIHLEIWFRLPGESWALLAHETLNLRNVTADFLPISTDGLNYITTTDEGYALTAPAGGDVKTFDPANATQGELLDFVATLAASLKTKGVI